MRSLRLLVAMADQPERERVVKTLSAEGCQVVGRTGDGLSAVRLSNSLRPDVAVVDSDLASRASPPIATALLEPKGPAVVLLSEPDQLGFAREFARRGASNCLIKPVTPDQLSLAVTAAAHTQERMHALLRRAETAERRLAERQVVEQAKALLMEQHQVDEATAYRYLRRLSMQSRRTLGDVAQLLLLNESLRSS